MISKSVSQHSLVEPRAVDHAPNRVACGENVGRFAVVTDNSERTRAVTEVGQRISASVVAHRAWQRDVDRPSLRVHSMTRPWSTSWTNSATYPVAGWVRICFGSADLDDCAVLHDAHPVADAEGLVEVVGDEHDRLLRVRLESPSSRLASDGE